MADMFMERPYLVLSLWKCEENRLASPSISAHFVLHLLCRALSDSPCATVRLYQYMFVCACLDMLASWRQEARPVPTLFNSLCRSSVSSS